MKLRVQLLTLVFSIVCSQANAGYKTEWTLKLYEQYPKEKLIREEKYLHSLLNNGTGVVIEGPTYNFVGNPQTPDGVFRFDLINVTPSSAAFILSIFDHMKSGEQWRSLVETEFKVQQGEKSYLKFSLGDLANPTNTGGANVYKLEFELKSISECGDDSTCFGH
jgi:hypothetical protein